VTPLRIVIADDHEMVRQGLRTVLEDVPGWEVCGEATNGREVVELARRLKPDLVILDISMPELDGLEATRQIRRCLPNSEILVLTMHDSEELAHETLAAGAKGFVLKNDAGRVLVQAVKSLAGHQPFLTSKVSAMVLNAYLNPGRNPGTPDAAARQLTVRQREIVRLIAEGHSNKEIAGRLGISVRTAETHRLNVMQKLKFHSVSDLVRYAVRNHIVQA
jgi:DNA-binding NarL/FixJ family response regulator